jgi:coenzyme F420-0:L-glutamate ligase/coenzyme F420-1:gamma-L-glutamate ligase
MNESDTPAHQALMDIIRTRRSIRRYRADAVPRAVVEDLIEAARWSPSAHNRQPWRFAIIEAAETRQVLATAMGARLRADLERDHAAREVIEADITRSYVRLTGAPLVIVVCLSMREMDAYPDARRQQAERMMAVQSTAMAAQNVLLAAHAQGLGACWVCAPLFVPELVREVLRLPADWEAQGLVTVGYPAETKTKTRKLVKEIAIYLDRGEKQ